MKKTIYSLLLTMILLVSFVLPTYASDKQLQIQATELEQLQIHAEALISMAIRDSNSNFTSGEYSLGERLNTYHAKSKSIDLFDETSFYPVFCDGDIVGILSVVNPDDENATYTFGAEFAEELSRAINQDEEYALVVSDAQIFAVTDSSISMIAKYDVGGTTLARMDHPASALSANNILQASAAKDAYIPETYSEEEIGDLIDAFGGVDLELSQSDLQLDPPLGQTRTIYGRYVETLTQEGLSCWAVSVMVIGNAMKGESYSVEDVYNAQNINSPNPKTPFQSGNNHDMWYGYKDLYGDVPGLQNRTLTQSEIEEQLRTKLEPFAMMCYTTNANQLGHTMACYMYDDSFNPYMVAVMDSLVGDYVYMTNVGDAYQRTVGGNTYEWMYSFTATAL